MVFNQNGSGNMLSICIFIESYFLSTLVYTLYEIKYFEDHWQVLFVVSHK